MLALPAQAASPPPTTVYEKALSDGGRISVSTERMPASPDILKFLSDWKAKASANVSVTLPDYSEAYTFNVKLNGQPQKMVWFERLDHFPGQELSEVKVLDATFESKVFVVALKLKEPDVIYAAVIDTSLQSQKLSFRDNVLTTDSDALGIYAKSAKIDGSILKGTLFVEVIFLSGKHEQFDWKDGKWVKRESSLKPPDQGKPNAPADALNKT